MVRRRELAEDLFQDLCVLVLQKKAELADIEHFPAWLRTAARHLAMNALRRRDNRGAVLGDQIHDLMEPVWRQFDGARESAMTAALQVCMEGLAPSARELLNARHVDGLSSGELARRLGRPAGSLYTTLSRIHKRLAECIARRLGAAGGSHG